MTHRVVLRGRRGSTGRLHSIWHQGGHHGNGVSMTQCKVHDNPVTGEHVVVLTDPFENDDEVLVAHMTVAPGGRVASPHLHKVITERFLVLSGRVGFTVGDEEVVLGAGEHATVEPGVVHDWWQVGEEPAEVLVEVVPGRRFSEMVSSLFGLAREGKLNAEGMPSPPQLGLIGAEYGDEITFMTPPPFIQKLTVPPLALIGRMRGMKASYPEHMDGSGAEEADPRALAKLTADGRIRPFI